MTVSWPFAESDAEAWPTKAGDAGGDHDTFLAMLEVRKKRADQEISRQTAADTFDDELYQAYYTGAIEVGKTSLDRAHNAADVVQKASAAIVTLYVGILSATFAATSKPMPFDGVFAAILLGLAVALSTAFIAYLPSKTIKSKAAAEITNADDVANDFVAWMREAASKRAYFLRASVLALGCAMFFLPAAFVGAADVPWITHPAKSATLAAEVPKGPVWPALDSSAASLPVPLQKVVYQAQVNEIVGLRKPTTPASKQSGGFWWVSFGIALLIVFGAPWIVGQNATEPSRTA